MKRLKIAVIALFALIATSNVNSGRVEIVVENSGVYLMGLVTQEEAKTFKPSLVFPNQDNLLI